MILIESHIFFLQYMLDQEIAVEYDTLSGDEINAIFSSFC